jgi:hypothetical protein
MKSLSRIVATLSLCLLAGACEALNPTPTDSSVLTLTPERTAEATAEAYRLDVTLNDVDIGITIPAGWSADLNDGLIVSEYTPRFVTDDMPARGVLMYVFVPSLDIFNLPSEMTPDHNMAALILEQVMEMPDLIGTAAVSEPRAFEWGQHKAAYYLLTSADGTHTIVLAVALPDQPHLVVCNISTPLEYDGRGGDLRGLLSMLLDNWSINGIVLQTTDLTALPDFFDFPPPPA